MVDSYLSENHWASASGNSIKGKLWRDGKIFIIEYKDIVLTI